MKQIPLMLTCLACALFVVGFIACEGKLDNGAQSTEASKTTEPASAKTAEKVTQDGSMEAPAAGEAAVCASCEAFKAEKKTGWCAECGKGYFEGKEVYCKKECGMNPGDPPCSHCVKQ